MNKLIGFFAFFFILAGITIAVVFIIILSDDNVGIAWNSLLNVEYSAQVGDFIGGVVGAVWALAGVLLFYLAFTKQKEALEIQKDEFRLQRKELERTRKVFESQN